MVYLSIDRCPRHSFMAVSINDGNGGSRLTAGKCCGSWSSIKSWSLTAKGIDEIVKELKSYKKKARSEK